MKMNFVISVRGFSVSIGYHVCNVRLQLTFTLDSLRFTLSEPRVLASYLGHVGGMPWQRKHLAHA